MIKTAILVDGGFYRKRAHAIAGSKTPQERADELEKYCKFHVGRRYLYRILYYDCPPLDTVAYHPKIFRQFNRCYRRVFLNQR